MTVNFYLMDRFHVKYKFGEQPKHLTGFYQVNCFHNQTNIINHVINMTMIINNLYAHSQSYWFILYSVSFVFEDPYTGSHRYRDVSGDQGGVNVSGEQP